MRKLIVCNIMSLDGYYEGPGNDVMAMPFDEAFDDYNAERLRAADTLLLGRRSYVGFKGYWPPVADDIDVRPFEREISRLDNAIDKVVISDTLTPEQTVPWADTTRIVARVDAREQIAELKRRPGKEILVFGSRTVWHNLLAAGLVDELHLMIGPAVLGRGGAGKSTAAARLGVILGVPVLELDTYFWSPDLTPRPRQEWIETQQRLAAGDRWVMDGDLGPYDALDTRLAAAYTVLVLDLSLLRCLWRVLRRSPERADFWWWMVLWRRRSRPGLMAAISEHAAAADVHVVRGPRALRRFLAGL